MRKSRKWKGKNREVAQHSETVENPAELPQTFNDEGEVPDALQALTVGEFRVLQDALEAWIGLYGETGPEVCGPWEPEDIASVAAKVARVADQIHG